MDLYWLYINNVVKTGGIEQFLRHVDCSSIVVFLNMLFLKYYYRQKHPIICKILNIGHGFG